MKPGDLVVLDEPGTLQFLNEETEWMESGFNDYEIGMVLESKDLYDKFLGQYYDCVLVLGQQGVGWLRESELKVLE